MNKQISTSAGIAIVVAISIVFIIMVSSVQKNYYPAIEDPLENSKTNTGKVETIGNTVTPSLKGDAVEKFQSEEDFKKYLEDNKRQEGATFGRGGGPELMSMSQTASNGVGMTKSSADVSTSSAPTIASPEPGRFSETNVQVLGIDEPDIVKTDGKEIFFSQPDLFYGGRVFYDKPVPMPMVLGTNTNRIMPPPIPENNQGQIKVIKATPISDLGVIGKIDKTGEMLLHNSTLIVFSENKSKVYGFDISDPQNPKEKWNMELKDGNDLLGARLYGNKIYLATRKSLDYYGSPCPLYPVAYGSGDTKSDLRIECNEIYHPATPVPAENTYSLISFDADSGQVENKTSFVGPWSDSAVYMSENYIYLSYNYPGDFIKILAQFLTENKDLIPDSVTGKIAKIDSYDISNNAKITEIESILDSYNRSLDNDNRMRMQNEITNRIQNYAKKHNREMESTGIVKINLADLNVVSTGKVPGNLLNQFSLDEYGGNLRVATTFGNSSWWWLLGAGNSGNNEGASDIYVLDKDMNTIGAVQDLGKGEKIYSVRFLEDKGYVVTFKQIDPFFVVDLSNPKNPSLSGELKIPGFSSYLHPIASDKILGVGSENGKVKVTLFDVVDPSNPKELATYNLDEYYTEVANNHHAFLLDKKHEAFFLPGSQGGYVFTYSGSKLVLAKALSDIQAQRAVYIDDNLYILSDNKVIVVDENKWEKVKEMEL